MKNDFYIVKTIFCLIKHDKTTDSFTVTKWFSKPFTQVYIQFFYSLKPQTAVCPNNIEKRETT